LEYANGFTEKNTGQGIQRRATMPREKIIKLKNQDQCYFPKTKQMSLCEAIRFVNNTTTFKAFILLDNRISHGRNCVIVEVVEKGKRIKPQHEILYDITS
jgi:hypothetical protein